MTSPIICFGQQPNGFFPKRFLVAKINTARKLREKIGGKIIFFYHDSDADYRETITIMKDRSTNAEARLNFTQENKLQKKFSPLYAKRIPQGWQEEMLKQLPRFVDKPMIEIFKSIDKKTAADFCLEMYRQMGLLDGIELVRSGDKNFRENAGDLQAYFADVKYQGEIVRAKIQPSLSESNLSVKITNVKSTDKLFGLLHAGGDVYTKIPLPDKLSKAQISPTADERFKWMQSVIHCTHYIYGEGEKEYLDTNQHPDVKFIQRDHIDNPAYSYIPNP